MKRVLRTFIGARDVAVVVAAIACVFFVSMVSVRVLEARLLEERREKIRAAVDTAYGVLAYFGSLAGDSRSPEEEQRNALAVLRSLRYGNGDYFWVQNRDCLLLSHPLPELQGKNLADLRDPTGRFFFREFGEKANSPERAGYVAYQWPRPGASAPVRKLSYVKLYEPWGWVIGSGTYLDDLDATVDTDARNVYLAGVLVALLLAAGGVGWIWTARGAKRLEIELLHSRKLEAVGQLAAGIAHEINTPMQYIGDNTRFQQEAFSAMTALRRKETQILAREPLSAEGRLALAQLAEEADLPYILEEVPDALNRTIQGVERVATIVRAMKEFAHPDQKQMVAADLNGAVKATAEVARNEYKYVADLELCLGEIPPVLCYPGDLNQVFLNLIVNAAHAIGDVVKGTTDKGKIKVSTSLEGSQVVVKITDTGTGIPEEIASRVFDPFFTTKGVGKGTGQGLAIARSILKKHKGTISFESKARKGTTFFVRLPADLPDERATTTERVG